tara:strand:+ start:1054 stop:1236 length:183 start_codon:yes stop_codon:yes gene_type:complete
MAYFGVKKGTGRTYCRLCLGDIEKGQPAIYVSGYRAGGQVHALPEHCPYLRKKLEELKEE